VLGPHEESIIKEGRCQSRKNNGWIRGVALTVYEFAPSLYGGTASAHRQKEDLRAIKNEGVNMDRHD